MSLIVGNLVIVSDVKVFALDPKYGINLRTYSKKQSGQIISYK